MTDIVEKLRQSVCLPGTSCMSMNVCVCDPMLGAVDEIERLRDESEQLRNDIAYWSDKMTEAHAEIRRLRVEAGYD